MYQNHLLSACRKCIFQIVQPDRQTLHQLAGGGSALLLLENLGAALRAELFLDAAGGLEVVNGVLNGLLHLQQLSAQLTNPSTSLVLVIQVVAHHGLVLAGVHKLRRRFEVVLRGDFQLKKLRNERCRS